MRQDARYFDPQTFLSTIGEGRRTLHVYKKQTIFTQADATDSVFYILKGKIKLTVVGSDAKERSSAY
jgi:CRP/FNR family cyclic AMP-dependent transcriptional regulator